MNIPFAAADCSGSVTVEVAYTESLEVRTGNSNITLNLLDTMSGTASLVSDGGGIRVEGLDGTADIRSHGGCIQVDPSFYF